MFAAVAMTWRTTLRLTARRPPDILGSRLAHKTARTGRNMTRALTVLAGASIAATATPFASNAFANIAMTPLLLSPSPCMRIAQGKGPFLFGQTPGMADAMYAPVCTRFLTYDVKLDSECAAYCRAIMNLPYMQDWVAAAKAEHEEVLELDVEF